MENNGGGVKRHRPGKINDESGNADGETHEHCPADEEEDDVRG